MKLNKKIKWIGLVSISLLVMGLAFFYMRVLLSSIPVEKNEVITDLTLNLKPESSILVNELQEDQLTIEVAQYNRQPLMEQAIVNGYQNREVPEIVGDLPWFYFSPNIGVLSPYSYANQIRLLKEEDFNRFGWYERDGVVYLYQDEKPFTGWYVTDFDGWYYFKDGQSQKNLHLVEEDLAYWQKNRSLHKVYGPAQAEQPFYQREASKYIDFVKNSTAYPHILYKNPNQIVLTSPPGTVGSALLTTTVDFIDMPMEVVDEVVTNDGNWLQVAIGYENLGWIPKDDTYTDYVPTYYSERALLDTIERVLAEEMSAINAVIGASFVNNETMAQVSVDNAVFFPASTQKIYILGEVYRQYAQGVLSPDDWVTLNSWDKVPGAGIIREQADGSQYTVNQLVDLVTIYSDNTAANLLIDTIGGGNEINSRIQKIGLYSTHIEGKYYQSEGQGFTTSPYDAARYFAYLYNDQINGDPWDSMLIDKFSQNTHNFLRQYIPGSTVSWNKSGLGETEQNDVATFVTPYGTYTLAVYTAYPANYKEISDQLGRLSARVHEVFNEMRLSLWTSVE